jgi:DUF4097 and DUF4098 domain-containing protein YvlB
MQQGTLMKVIIFLLVGLAFVIAMITYSNARSDRGGKFVDEEEYAPSSDDSHRTIEKSFDVKPGGRLRIDIDEGSVAVDSWEEPRVALHIEMSGEAEELNKIRLQFDADDSTVALLGKWKRNGFFNWHWQSSEVRVHATVPKEFRVKIITAGGDIDVRELSGNFSGKTSGGDLRLSSVAGEVFGETSGGEVILKRIKGNVRVHTSGGDVQVDSLVGDLNAETSGGDVVILDVDGKVSGQTSGGRIEARLVGENKGIRLRTSGGSVVLYLPKSVAGTVQASTSGGSVNCDLPITVSGKLSDQELRGSINGGGNLIELSTSGGNINIRAHD